jgi:hypothetical protein
MNGIQPNKKLISMRNAMRDIQGSFISQLLAKVKINSSDQDSAPEYRYFLEVPGVLLGFIDGFTLSNIEENVPRVLWRRVCDAAIQVVNIVCDHNILNKDARPDNVTVRAFKGSSHDYKVYMIDFVLSRLRGSDETDSEQNGQKMRKVQSGM